MSKFKEGPMVEALRDENFEAFNRSINGDGPDLSNANLRSLDLRHANLKNADLRDAYMHSVDLRGVDLSSAKMQGASLHHARVAGAYFPPDIPAEEILMSIEHGTRLRAMTDPY